MTAILTGILIVVATICGALAARREESAAPQGRAAWVRTIAYWLLTIIVAYELAAGAVWDLLRIDYVRAMLTQLGYPQYLLYILGAWRIPGALALLAPRFPRLKEWAYAGAFFDYSGAAASHLFVGHNASEWAPPLVFAIFTLISWALRPAGRRLPQQAPAAERRVVTWSVPVVIVAAMLVVAFFTMPKVAPPQ